MHDNRINDYNDTGYTTHESSIMYRLSIVYVTYIYRVSIVYLSCIYRVCLETDSRQEAEKKGEGREQAILCQITLIYASIINFL